MKTLLNDLFEQNGFLCKEDNSLSLYFRDPEHLKKEFWVVLTIDFHDLLEQQSQIYERCKLLNTQAELDKNISLIIPIKVDDQAHAKRLQPEILRIEEDNFFFKKHVLIFTDQELADFRTQQGDRQTNEFLTKEIAQQSCFEQYKAGPRTHQWQSLVYRLANKIPFIELKIKVNKDLTSLYELKSTKVQAASLESLESRFEEAFGTLTYLQVSQYTPEAVIDMLDQIQQKEDGTKI